MLEHVKTFEEPKYLTCIHNKHKKPIETFRLKIVIFTAILIRSIVPKRIIVMVLESLELSENLKNNHWPSLRSYN